MLRPALSILIPTYNRSSLLRETISSVLRQRFSDYELIVSDDCSTDDTAEVVQAFGDARIRYIRNERNLGYGGNLEAGAAHASGEILYLLGHDDLLLASALEHTYKAFCADPSIGIVTRPYYWFLADPRRPVRAVPPYDATQDAVLSLHDGREAVQALFRSAGQLSGLGFRRCYWEKGFHHHIFTAHIYPFADILRRARAVYLKDYAVAVRIESSMTRHRPEIYDPSPTETWIQMFETVYPEPVYQDVRRWGIELITGQNFEGLVQLRNYSNTKAVLREIRVMLCRRPRNLLAAKFWLYGLLSLFTPAPVLRRLADGYKQHVLARALDASQITRGLQLL
jgi:glycosyltransferase involved in cell wall biosynthesis